MTDLLLEELRNARYDAIDCSGSDDIVAVHFWHGGCDELEISGEVHLLFDLGEVEDGEVIGGTVRVLARGRKVRFNALKKHNQEKIKNLVIEAAFKKYEEESRQERARYSLGRRR